MATRAALRLVLTPMSESDYCDLCDLPRAQCIHGRPPAPPAPTKTAVKAAPKPRKATSSATTSKARVVTKSTARKWTPPDAFAPHILTILEDAGGELPNDDLYDSLEEAVGEIMLPGDREKTPDGDLRWRYAARRARQKLISEGRMTSGAPGVWRLA